MIFNGTELCDNCFSTMTSGRCESCGFSLENYSPDPTVLAVGAVLQNRYRIGGIIGKGGFGVTYLALDTKLERRIAVKEYFPYGFALRGTGTGSVMTTGDAQVFKKGADKFYDEARLIAKFNSTGNIVNVYDVFYENDTVYYVMEYLRGQTIKSYTEKGGRLTPGQAVYIAGEIADALGIAHEMNVLHRDITPDNIMLCPDNKVKLIDFGAARQVVSEGSQSLSVILTQGFAPLEQYQKKGKQGPWTDIYSLGASLYYGMTGEIIDDPMSRFENDTAFQSNPCAITGELWEIIKKAVAIKTSDRYQNAAELRNALGAISIRPEKIDIPKSEIKIKAAQGAVSRTGVASEKPAPQPEPMTAMPVSIGSDMRTQPVGQSEQMRTMPVNNSSQMRTMPVNYSSQMRTMPVNDSSQMRTMAVNDNSQMRTMAVNDEQIAFNAANEKTKKKWLIGIIAGAAALVLIVGVIIGVAVGGGNDDDITLADETEAETTTVSVTEKETTTAETEETTTEETTTEETTTAKPKEQEPPPTTTAAKEPEPPETGWTNMTDSNLRITYSLPSGYAKESNSTDDWLTYQNNKASSTLSMEFITAVNFPICSYKDIPGSIDEILDIILPGKRSNAQGEYFDYNDGEGGRGAWMYVFQNEQQGTTFNCIYTFIDSKTKYGCYGFYAGYKDGDTETENIVLEFLDSIAIIGTPDGLIADSAEVYRGDLGINGYNVYADVGFFYSAPGYTLEGGDGEALWIKKSSSDFVEVYVTNQSMETYCDRTGFDKSKIQTVTYGGTTFDYIIEDSYYGNKWNFIFSVDVGDGRYLKIVVDTSDESLTWTVENNILPSIHIYE